MRDALNEFYIRGVSHNISFLAALVEHPRFREGRLSTNLIAEEYPDGFHRGRRRARRPGAIDHGGGAIHRRYHGPGGQDQRPTARL